jgi:hypothetical protein
MRSINMYVGKQKRRPTYLVMDFESRRVRKDFQELLETLIEQEVIPYETLDMPFRPAKMAGQLLIRIPSDVDVDDVIRIIVEEVHTSLSLVLNIKSMGARTYIVCQGVMNAYRGG